MKEEIKRIVISLLQKNNWGIYFKGQPLIEMPVNGQGNIYKLNDISIDELEGAISDEFDIFIKNINQQGEAECQEKKDSLDER